MKSVNLRGNPERIVLPDAFSDLAQPNSKGVMECGHQNPQHEENRTNEVHLAHLPIPQNVQISGTRDQMT